MSNRGAITLDDEVFGDFEDMLKSYSKKADTQNVDKALELGAKELVSDLLKLPKPISDIKKDTYTHLIHTFAYEMKNHTAIVGWGKYYGPMVENGTRKMSARPHLKPTYEINKDRCYRVMLNSLGF